MKQSKKTVFKQSVIFAGVTGVLLFLGACSSTKVLESNGDIPAPSLTPPENANQVVTQELQTQPVISTPEQPEVIQTATSVPGFKEGVEGKVKYTVKRGDSLWRVSKMFDVSVRELAAYNNIDINRGLKVGTILQVPPSGLAAPRAIPTIPSVKLKKHMAKASVVASKKTSATTHSGNGAKSYMAKKVDSPESVAKKYGITVKELVAANPGLTEESKLRVGQKLSIPAKAEKIEKAAVAEVKTTPDTETKQAEKALNDLTNSVDTAKQPVDQLATTMPAVAASATTAVVPTAERKPAAVNYLPHTVKDGDTWQAISDMYGLNVDDLRRANVSVVGEPKIGTTVNIPEE